MWQEDVALQAYLQPWQHAVAHIMFELHQVVSEHQLTLSLYCNICRSFTYEDFILAQEKFQNSQAEALAVRSGEVARAVEDVITLVQVRLLLGAWLTSMAQQQPGYTASGWCRGVLF